MLNVFVSGIYPVYLAACFQMQKNFHSEKKLFIGREHSHSLHPWVRSIGLKMAYQRVGMELGSLTFHLHLDFFHFISD